jgi:hypothetical protein
MTLLKSGRPPVRHYAGLEGVIKPAIACPSANECASSFRSRRGEPQVRLVRTRKARTQQIYQLVRNGRYRSGPLVPTVSRAFAAFERQGFAATIDALNRSPANSNASAVAAHNSTWWSSPY